MTDVAPDDPEPLAIPERTSVSTRAANALRIAAGNRYLVFRGAEDQPDGTLMFRVAWDGGEWLLTADEAMFMAAIAARSKHGWTGYLKVLYRRGMLQPEDPHDTTPGNSGAR
jgi:hypothetical protein